MAETGTNPYLALLQQEEKPPGWAQILQHIGNLGFGLAGGFGQAATTGQPTMAGIGPGLMMGNQMNAQAAHQAEQERMKRLDLQFKAQEHEDKRAERLRKEKQLQLMAGLYGPNGGPGGPMPGFNLQPNPTQMGPQPSPPTQPGADLKTGGAPLVDYLVAQHNLSPLAASTLIGNLGWESPGFNTSQRHDGGRGFGLAGWDPSRTAGLQAFAAAKGKPVTDLQTQLDYAVDEMKSGKDIGAARAYAMLQQATTPEQANAAIMHFFRPQGYTPANPTGGHGFGGRVANTRALLPQSRPGDPETAPVPGVTPDPDEAPVSAQGPAPRPGLGPRAMPVPGGPQFPAPDGVPLAQGGGEGEVVLPRLGLPFPARAPTPAPPGSVPFPTVAPAAAAPATPAQTAPGTVPSDIMPPPVPALPDRPTLTQADSVRLQSLVLGGHPEQAQSEYNRILQMQRSEVMERHKSEVEVWKQRMSDRQFSRGQAATLEAENRRAAEEQKRHDRDAAERQKVREDAAKQTGDKLTFEQTKAQRDQENKLRDDFNGLKPVQDFRKADLVFQSAQKAAKTDTPAADLNLVYAFATMMDPGSVVRDQETGMVIATQNASDRVKAYVAMVSGEGSRLAPKAKRELIAEMASRHSGYKEAHDAYATAAEEIATRQGLDPRNVVSRVVVEKAKEENANEPPLYDKNGKRITKP